MHRACVAAILFLQHLSAAEDVFTPEISSWAVDPSEIVREDAHIEWSRFVPVGTLPEAPRSFPRLDWAKLTNPILASRHGAIKNQAIVYHDGWFWIFPAVDIERGRALVRTRDFNVYEYLEPAATFGIAPRIILHQGIWQVLYQMSAPDADRRIYYSSSRDLMHWTQPVEAWPQVQSGARHIDGAIAWEGGRYYVGFKSGQQFHVMRSRSDSFDMQWEEPAKAYAQGWCEAYQFVEIDNTWRMVATARAPDGFATEGSSYTGDHEPYIYTMDGDGSRFEHWRRWKDKTHIALPFSDWNRVMHANSAYLCDWREYDGWFYLFFAGANDDVLCRRRGHCKLGVARSRDLVTWHLPGETDAP